MKKVSILVPKHAVMQAIADPQYCFSAVNQFLLASGKKALFDIQLVGQTRRVPVNAGQYTVHADQLLQDVQRTDLVFIPALFGDMPQAVAANRKLIPWILAQYAQGAEIASLCVGAFLLAETGLLDGKKCSTHWGFAQQFQEMYPKVDVQDGSIVTEEGGIYSSGGANAYWNLLLHLVEKYVDRETAILTSKYFAVDIDRNSQSAYAMFKGQKEHGDESIRMAQEFIESNIDERFTVDALADRVHVGRRSFERRFKMATKNSVLEYMQRVRVEAAKRHFESSRKNINQVMLDVGYTDTKAFRTTFKRITGLTPIEYRNKYHKLPV